LKPDARLERRVRRQTGGDVLFDFGSQRGELPIAGSAAEHVLNRARRG
jgi:hypothetical protein